MQIKSLSIRNFFQNQGVNKNKYLTLPAFSKLERSPKADTFSFCGANAAYLDSNDESYTDRKDAIWAKDFSTYELRKEYLDNNKNHQEFVEYDKMHKMCRSLYCDEDDDIDLAGFREDDFKKIAFFLNDDYYCKLLKQANSPYDELSVIADIDERTSRQFDYLLHDESMQKVIDKKNLPYAHALQLAQLSGKKFSSFNQLMKNSNIQRLFVGNNVTVPTLVWLTKLPEQKIERLYSILDDASIQKFINNNTLDEHVFFDFARLTDESYDRLCKLLSDSRIKKMVEDDRFESSYLSSLVYYGDKRFEKFNNLINIPAISTLINEGKIYAENILEIVESDEHEPEKLDSIFNSKTFKKLVENKKVDPLFFQSFVELSYSGVDKLKTLLENRKIKSLVNDNKINSKNLINMLLYDIKSKTIEKTLYLMNNGFAEVNASAVAEILKNNPEFNPKGLCRYARKVDFGEIEKIAPEVKYFNSTNKLYFLNYHFGERKTDFKLEDLQLGKDFGEYLSREFLDADGVCALYSAFPATSRNVGNLPEDWTKGIAADDVEFVKDEIINSIDNFLQSRDVSDFESELNNIFGNKVKVREIGKGAFGVAYKISVPDSKDVCLKLFYDVPKSLSFAADPNINNQHGRFIEVQNALFANTHSTDFVKMYFGRLGIEGKNDAFMVTQFLSPNANAEKNQLLSNSDDYSLTPFDTHHNNYVLSNGKSIYIDFGALKIVNKKTGERLTKGDWARTNDSFLY